MTTKALTDKSPKLDDAKGVFDAIHRSESAVLSMQDERSAIQCLALREAMGSTKTVHTAPHITMDFCWAGGAE